MTYKRHWLLSWGGTLADGKDIWANNVRFQNDASGVPDNVDDDTMESMLTDFVADIRAFVTSPNTYISSQVQCTWVKFNEIGPDGRYTNQTKTHARYLVGGAGPLAVMIGATAGNVPSFQSCAITTTTARQRGPASKGRLFLPQCNAPMIAGGVFSPAAVTAMANSAASFLTALADEAGVDSTSMKPAVVSNVGTPGPSEPITGVKVGNVPDVIAKRKNAIDELYTTAVVNS